MPGNQAKGRTLLSCSNRSVAQPGRSIWFGTRGSVVQIHSLRLMTVAQGRAPGLDTWKCGFETYRSSVRLTRVPFAFSGNPTMLGVDQW